MDYSPVSMRLFSYASKPLKSFPINHKGERIASCCLFNVCTRDRGNGKIDSATIQSKPLYTRQKLLGAQFQTALYHVFESIGLRSEGDGNQTRLQGIPQELCDL